MHEIGQKGSTEGDEFLVTANGDSRRTPRLPGPGEVLVAGLDVGLTERLFVCRDSHDAQSAYSEYSRGGALNIRWYHAPEPVQREDGSYAIPDPASIKRTANRSLPPVPLLDVTHGYGSRWPTAESAAASTAPLRRSGGLSPSVRAVPEGLADDSRLLPQDFRDYFAAAVHRGYGLRIAGGMPISGRAFRVYPEDRGFLPDAGTNITNVMVTVDSNGEPLSCRWITSDEFAMLAKNTNGEGIDWDSLANNTSTRSPCLG